MPTTPDGLEIYDDSNIGEVIEFAEKNPFYGRGLMPRDYSADPFSYVELKEIGIPHIEPKDYQDKIREITEKKIRKFDTLNALGWIVKNQGSSSLCWMYAAVGALEQLIAIQSGAYVDLAATGAAMMENGFKDQGGWGTNASKHLKAVGTCTAKYWINGPAGINRKYAFDPNGDSPQAKECKKYQIDAYVTLEPGNHEQLMDALFARDSIVIKGDSRWRHEIIYTDPEWINNAPAARMANSWGKSWSANGWSVLAGNRFFSRADDAICYRLAQIS